MNRLITIVCLLTAGFGLEIAAQAATVIWPSAELTPWGAQYYTLSTGLAGDAGVAGVDVVVEDDEVGTMLDAWGVITAVGSFWYETDLGDPVDADAVATADPFAENFTGALGSVDMAVDEIFYIAFWLDTDGGGAGGSTDVYGWVALVYDGTTLTLVDSAAETSGVGIYAGTYTPIPEPDTACLALTGLAVLVTGRRWWARRR